MATLRTLATALGVSTSTISRALNGHPHVDEALRSRIQTAAREVRYVPDPLARSLKTQRSSWAGLLLPDIQNDFYTAAAAAIVRELTGAGYRVQLSITDNDPALQTLYLEALRRERGGGVIYVPCTPHDEAVARLLEASTPVVELARRSGSNAVDSVVADERAGAYAATMHLLGLGHQRIGFISGPLAFSTARERQAGYRQALAAAGCPEEPTLVRLGTFDRTFGHTAASELLSARHPPTAILAASNELLIGVMRAAYAHGAAIPESLSVIGFGNPDWFALAHPPVTTVALPMEEMAAAAAQHLLRRMRATAGTPASQAGATPPARPGVHLSFDAPLLVRGSTAPPRYAPGAARLPNGALPLPDAASAQNYVAAGRSQPMERSS